MPDTPEQIGGYRVDRELGRGGMGVVYLAHDSRLDRRVAIKALPEHLAEDAERLARFEREARTLAQLNHPHVAGIHGIEESEGRRYLVLEFVEGATLGERLERGPLEIDEALELCAQIAAGLESAHEAGVVHRDLKPANIKITPDGKAVVLDFGLAKSTGEHSSDTSALSEHPTLTTPYSPGGGSPTMPGAILGTAPYMSPEQARGRSVDKRTDVWSFGCVLFECLTGATLFAGETATDSIGAILHKEIDLGLLPPATPARVRELLSRMLERDRDHRLRDLGDAMLELRAARAEIGKAPVGTQTRRARRGPSWGMLISSAAIAALVAAAGVWSLGPRGAGAPAAGVTEDQPARAARPALLRQLTDTNLVERWPTLSSDGSTVIYARRDAAVWNLYSQRVGGYNALNLTPGAESDDITPALSPDGQSIAFRSSRQGGGIFAMGATGEFPRRLTDFGFHPSWSPDGGSIVFCTEGIETPTARTTESELWIFQDDPPDLRRLYAGDAVEPAWSPDGNWIAFWFIHDGGQRDIALLPAAGGDAIRITDDEPMDYKPVWSADGRHLYFSSDRGGNRDIWRIAIDPETGAPASDPEPITFGSVSTTGDLAVSGDGTRLAYMAASARSTIERLDLEADGVTPAGPPVQIADFSTPSSFPDVSPDGERLVYSTQGHVVEDIFLIDVDGTNRRRLTNDRAKDRGPRWSPDGRSIVYYSNRAEDNYHLWQIDVESGRVSALSDPLIRGAGMVYSPDGRLLAIDNISDRTAIYSVDDFSTPIVELPDWNSSTTRVATLGWAPSGREMLVALIPEAGSGRGALAMFSLDTNEYDVALESVDFSWAAMFPDGRRMLLLTQEVIESVDLESGQRTPIHRVTGGLLGGTSGGVSPDGSWIYFVSRRAYADLWMVELETE